MKATLIALVLGAFTVGSIVNANSVKTTSETKTVSKVEGRKIAKNKKKKGKKAEKAAEDANKAPAADAAAAPAPAGDATAPK